MEKFNNKDFAEQILNILKNKSDDDFKENENEND